MIGGILLLLIAIVLIRTFTFQPPVLPTETEPMHVERDMQKEVETFAKALTYPTIVSMDYEATDFGPFEDFRIFLKESFPRVHETCDLTMINTHSMVFHWKGKNAELLPILFLAHYDVVPAAEETLANWTYPPFSGTIADGNIYGRGTLDDKNELMSLMQTAENLMAQSFTPERDIYFAFGHDEEQGGRQGAMNITAYFEEHNMHFDAVYDEGGVVIEGAIASVKTPLAVIGVAEKGYNNIRVTVTSKGGHSSMPPKHTALGDLAQIAVNIEKHPMNPILTPIVKDLLTNICNEMGFAVKMAVRNLWLFKPILFKVLGASPATNAMIRTTFAATMAKGSDAPNIMPQTTEMIVNVRVLPGNTPEEALDHVKSLAQGIDAKVEPILKEEASPISDLSGKGYAHLLNAIGDIYPNAIPTAYLVLGGTDARKYYNVSNAIYRFMPAQITNEEQGTMHAANEYISIENYKRMIVFYEKLITGYDA
jgi:carboxypeptidase PM20D1